MFFDVNIVYEDEGLTSSSQLREKTILECIQTLKALGYDGCAINHLQGSKKIPGKKSTASSSHKEESKNLIKTLLDRLEKSDASFCASRNSLLVHHVRQKQRDQFSLYSRITLVLEDASQNFGLSVSSSTSSFLNEYDLIAVQPMTEKLLQTACSNLDVDIISLDMSSRLPFYLKYTTIRQAIDRGILFEISYAPVIRDTANSRRNLISNAMNLVRITRGKHILLSSGALHAMELRGPYDVMNLASIFGLRESQAREAMIHAIDLLLRRAGK
jgi:RNase P/RNase MRP subunit p30